MRGWPELVSDRRSQRRDRLASIGVGGQSQVLAAVDLGAPPCAALVQEGSDQQRLKQQHADGGQHCALVFVPQARATKLHDAARRQPALGDAPSLQLAPVECRLTRRLRRDPEACRRRAVQESTGDVGRVAGKAADGHHRPTDDSMSEYRAERGEHRSIGRGVKVGEHLLVGIRPALCVRAEGQIDDRRVAGKARDAAQDVWQRQVVGPDECQAIAKSCELALEHAAPEPAERSGPDHHEDLLGVGQYLQDVIDQARKIVDDRDRGLVVRQGRVAQESLVHRSEQERCLGEKLAPILAREYSRRSAHRHDEVRGRTIGVDRSDVVDDRLVRRADEPCGSDDDLNDVHGLACLPVQANAKVAGELIEDEIPAVQRMQHEDLLRCGLGIARCRNDHQQACQQRELPSAADAGIGGERKHRGSAYMSLFLTSIS